MVQCFHDIFKNVREDVPNTERWDFVNYSDMSPGRFISGS